MLLPVLVFRVQDRLTNPSYSHLSTSCLLLVLHLKCEVFALSLGARTGASSNSHRIPAHHVQEAASEQWRHYSAGLYSQEKPTSAGDSQSSQSGTE